MADYNSSSRRDLKTVLGIGSTKHRRSWKLYSIVIAIALVVIGLVFFYNSGNNASSQPRFKTAAVTQGDLVVKVTATGVIQPVNQVDVGTEISGTVKSVEVDFNDRVKAGQVLARLSSDQLEAKFRQTMASLELAKAKVKEMEATVGEAREKARRAGEMKKSGMCSQEECDAMKFAYVRAEATMASARAQVNQAQAQVDADRITIEKTKIISPINGIVLKRQVEPGQTVAASLQTPVLFTLAENLAQMELHVAVDEADVGLVEEGQQATFNVDAYANRPFSATVKQVRFAPQTLEGVVTYGAVLAVENTDLSLRPGMTATADMTVKTLNSVMLIPNAALRFEPPSAKEKEKKSSSGLVGSLFGGRPPSTDQKRKDTSENARQRRVWVLQDGRPQSIPVQIGATDGKVSQLVKGDIAVGTELLIDTITPPK